MGTAIVYDPAMAGPALPWGNVPQQELPTLPNLGSTIEIKWELENTEEGTATVKVT